MPSPLPDAEAADVDLALDVASANMNYGSDTEAVEEMEGADEGDDEGESEGEGTGDDAQVAESEAWAATTAARIQAQSKSAKQQEQNHERFGLRQFTASEGAKLTASSMGAALSVGAVAAALVMMMVFVVARTQQGRLSRNVLL
eukprot:3603665-Pleurochrysis_carterae.AAC.1